MNPATLTYAVQIFCCLFAAGVLIYVFLPSRDTDTGVDKTRVSYLYERKEVVYENLRDLNFEFKAGKMPDSDYQSLKASLQDEAATLLAEIARLEGKAAAGQGAR